MIRLQLLAESPVVKALGWTVFHFLWEGAAVALVLSLVLTLARSARVRYAAACGAMILLLAGFAGTFVRLNGRDFTGNSLRPALPALIHIPGNGSGAALSPSGSMDLASWAGTLWLAGVLALYFRSAGGWLTVHRWRTKGVCAPDPYWLDKFEALRNRLQVSQKVRLLQSGLAEVPMVLGYLRPVVLMPVRLLTGMPERQIEYILLHELAHIRRHDYAVNLLQTLAEGLLFYHPAVWWISGVIRMERENCCDDVAAGYGDPQEYAATLAALEVYRQTAEEPALAATGGNLMKRIRRLLKQPEGPTAALTPIFTTSLIFLSAGIALAWQSGQPPKPVVLAQANGSPTQAGDIETPWERWLKQDVAWIITAPERAAFLNLRSDIEREHFVEQFWDRRNPVPGAQPNPYKEEHYRRIAFANQHFSGGGVSGWKADRGHMYIVFGPPDEIDSHPAGGRYKRLPEQGGGETSVYPFEQWKYKYIEGIGTDVVMEFVDTTMTGDFRMTTDPREKESGKIPGN